MEHVVSVIEPRRSFSIWRRLCLLPRSQEIISSSWTRWVSTSCVQRGIPVPPLTSLASPSQCKPKAHSTRQASLRLLAGPPPGRGRRICDGAMTSPPSLVAGALGALDRPAIGMEGRRTSEEVKGGLGVYQPEMGPSERRIPYAVQSYQQGLAVRYFPKV